VVFRAGRYEALAAPPKANGIKMGGMDSYGGCPFFIQTEEGGNAS